MSQWNRLKAKQLQTLTYLTKQPYFAKTKLNIMKGNSLFHDLNKMQRMGTLVIFQHKLGVE